VADETVLALSGEGIPPYSVRGVTETLEPIEAAGPMRRTVNGTLVSLSAAQFAKYRWAITCSDVQSPAFDAIWPGDTVTVDCISELGYKTSGGSPARTVVSGSSWVQGAHTYYRPQLIIMITAKNQETDEYGAVVSWSLEGEELG
jgi:hypothetical protein